MSKQTEAIMGAVAKLLAKEVKRLEEMFLNGASPVEQQASLIADSIFDDLRQFTNTVPTFDVGSKTPNPVVKLTWLKD
ncbi:hypothetical protein [Ruegeria profundi]|uniref:hypothetical protein n=1 Tax=Ruegeria profundi TaxID=1685378 RepID=UPI001CD76E85|nr:hypothetical protein [Ruegeria profundi]MCA0927149.1 hypothetical protein [Ruegeria profundi]